MKILVVDDDPFIRAIMKKTLTLSGYSDVTFTASAEEAVQVIAETSPPFECMFLDMKMPEADGDELCQWVRRMPEYQETPIVMVTALGKKADIDRAFAAGASDYVTKPLDLAEFNARVDRIKRCLDKGNNFSRKAPSAGPGKTGSDRTDFSKPMLVGRIPSEIKLGAMENYLKQLSQVGIRDMDAFSFAIRDAAKLHFLCSRELFVTILQATGMVISKHLPKTQHFLAFAGQGTFAGLARGLGESEDLRDEIEKNVQQELSRVVVPSRKGSDIPIIPFMSVPQRLNVSQGQHAVDALYKTIVEAEGRCRPALFVA